MIWLATIVPLLGVLLGVLGCVLMLRRNTTVYLYRMHLLRQVSEAAHADIYENHQPFEWRYRTLMSVSYEEMFRRFWRPIDSFYPDRNFLDPTATAPEEADNR